jgi:hypothetical protein
VLDENCLSFTVEITGVTESPQKKGRGKGKGKAATPSLPLAAEAKKKGLDLSSVSLILFEEVHGEYNTHRLLIRGSPNI